MSGMSIPRSIRWRLPLSYAIIALLAALALGAVLLTTLRSYYALREYDNLLSNARVVGDIVGSMVQDQQPSEVITAQLRTLSFVSQARIRLLDANNIVLADSGNPWETPIITMMYQAVSAFESTEPVTTERLAAGTINLSENGQRLHLSQVTDGDNTQFWISSPAGETGTGIPFPDDETAVAIPAANTLDRFTVALAGSPYGVALRRESTPAVTAIPYSDQAVAFTMHDRAENVLGTVELSNGPAYGTEIIEGVMGALVVAGAAAVLLAAGVGWFISRSITAPLLALSEATTRMANGELSTRVALARGDEFGVLAKSFDEMAQRVDATVTTLRRFVADAAHQIHTPLTAVHADLELAASEPNTLQRAMFIERALGQLRRLEALTNDLLDLSRLEARATDDHRVRVDLVALVSEISEGFASRAEQAGISFALEIPPAPILASVNETQFRHAIGNLLDNAIKFTPENGTITLGVRCAGEQVELWVNDTGIGISDEDLPQIFNRFHRGRNAAAYPGSGLGLAIIKAIVEGHHGQLSVESRAGNGTRFAFRVPAGA